ncbi:uncharacterized protein M6D78_000947 [Vipera latastei]
MGAEYNGRNWGWGRRNSRRVEEDVGKGSFPEFGGALTSEQTCVDDLGSELKSPEAPGTSVIGGRGGSGTRACLRAPALEAERRCPASRWACSQGGKTNQNAPRIAAWLLPISPDCRHQQSGPGGRRCLLSLGRQRLGGSPISRDRVWMWRSVPGEFRAGRSEMAASLERAGVGAQLRNLRVGEREIPGLVKESSRGRWIDRFSFCCATSLV